MGLLDYPVKLALSKAKDAYINPQLEGIGAVEELTWKDGSIRGTLRLADLEDHPIEVVCSDIRIAPDGGSIVIGKLASNKKFAENAFKRFVEGRQFEIPEGAARAAALTARKLLGLG